MLIYQRLQAIFTPSPSRMHIIYFKRRKGREREGIGEGQLFYCHIRGDLRDIMYLNISRLWKKTGILC